MRYSADALVTPGLYLLASYPKSGNTWLRMVLENLLSKGDAPVGINELDRTVMATSRKWLDSQMDSPVSDLHPKELLPVRSRLHSWLNARAAAPIFLKVHDANLGTRYGPLFQNDACKGAIYILRNPLDIACSLAAHLGKTIDQAIDHIVDPDARLAQFSGRGIVDQVEHQVLCWSGHVDSWLGRKQPNTIIVRYEDMHSAPMHTFGRAADHLGITHDETTLSAALEGSAFSKLQAQEEADGFRERPHAASRFFRLGRPGEGREQLSPSQRERVIDRHHKLMIQFNYL